MLHSRKTLWNPWHDLMDWDRTLSPLFGMPSAGRDFPPATVWTGENRIVFVFELPGIRAEELEISAKPDTLTVKGRRNPHELPAGAQYLRQECGCGAFSRSFALPFKVDPDAVEASYVHGMLTITLPKAQEVRPRKISVSVK